MNLDAILEQVLVRERGYVNNPADKGGATKYGVTAATLGAWRKLGRKATPAEVATLTPFEAKAIFADQYVRAPGFLVFGDRPAFLAVLVDLAINSGPKRAIILLQRTLGVVDDGVLGPKTIAAARAQPDVRLALRLSTQRLRFLGRLISGDLTDKDKDGIPDNAEFAAGWINRTCDQIDGLT